MCPRADSMKRAALNIVQTLETLRSSHNTRGAYSMTGRTNALYTVVRPAGVSMWAALFRTPARWRARVVTEQGRHRTPSQGGAQEFCTGKHEKVS